MQAAQSVICSKIECHSLLNLLNLNLTGEVLVIYKYICPQLLAFLVVVVVVVVFVLVFCLFVCLLGGGGLNVTLHSQEIELLNQHSAQG